MGTAYPPQVGFNWYPSPGDRNSCTVQEKHMDMCQRNMSGQLLWLWILKWGVDFWGREDKSYLVVGTLCWYGRCLHGVVHIPIHNQYNSLRPSAQNKPPCIVPLATKTLFYTHVHPPTIVRACASTHTHTHTHTHNIYKSTYTTRMCSQTRTHMHNNVHIL